MELFLIYPGCRFASPWAMRSLGFQPVTTLKKGQPDHSFGLFGNLTPDFEPCIKFLCVEPDFCP